MADDRCIRDAIKDAYSRGFGYAKSTGGRGYTAGKSAAGMAGSATAESVRQTSRLGGEGVGLFGGAVRESSRQMFDLFKGSRRAQIGLGAGAGVAIAAEIAHHHHQSSGRQQGNYGMY